MQPLLVLGHALGLRDGAGPEHGPQLLVEVGEVLVLEQLPRRKRHLVAVVRQFVVDDAALAERTAVNVDCPDHPVRAGIDGAVNDGAAARMAHQDHRGIEGVDLRHHGVDVGAQADAGPRRVGRFQPGQRQRVDLMPGRGQRRGHLLPR